MSQLKNGTLLRGGMYEIVRFISRGGFGCTYEAVHVDLGKHVAIKEFFVDDFCDRNEATSEVFITNEKKRALIDRLNKKFLEEAKAVASFKHPHIVSVSDVFRENGTAYYVMDFIDGCSIAEYIKKHGAMNETVAVKIIDQLCDALRYVHSKNRLHLDVKPGNIMIDKDFNVTLIDFGVSKQYDEVEGENTSTLAGFSKGFAPVEQQTASITKFLPATDIYAVGATLYNMLTGQTPPDANLLASGDPLPKLPESVSPRVVEAVTAAMTPMKLQRPQSIDEFQELLHNEDDLVEATIEDDSSTIINDPTPSTPTPPVLPTPPSPEPTHNSNMVWTIFIVAICLIPIAIKFITYCYNDETTLETDEHETTIETDEPETVVVEEEVVAEVAWEPQTYNVNGVEFTMIPVDGGTFQMGTNDVNSYNIERPAHSVTLSDYWIGETEVTQELWEAVMGNNPSYFKGAKRPVDNVSWEDCKSFIDKLNELKGENFRLPTEAEWEFAARGGNESKGTKFSGSDDISEVAWYESNSSKSTHDVMTKLPNELGIYDMSGNVFEWCEDWFDPNYYKNSPEYDPVNLSPAEGHVIRGGCWYWNPYPCRVWSRNWDKIGNKSERTGLRLAQSL